MSTLSYDDLAVSWSIENQANRLFNIITIIVLTVMIAAAIAVSLIDVPEEERQARKKIPPRIVQFLLEKKKATPKKQKVIPPPKPESRPKPKPKPKVDKVEKKPETNQKPLTKTQKEAREVAAESGLLALSNELSDLMDTDDITAMVGGAVSTGNTIAALTDSTAETALLSGAAEGSGGISDNQVATVTTGKTVRLQRSITTVEQSLVKEKPAQKQAVTATDAKREGGVRSEESVTLVFDRNKSKLFALYNRARRKNPNLKGKVILEITIAPSGKVTRIIVVTSELNDKTLESGLLKRIKLFDFGTQPVEQVTVTYPIEFLPS